MTNVFLTDVLDQANVMRNALANYAHNIEALEALHDYSPKEVLFVGMGSSHYCSQGAVIRLNQAGIHARMESASEILHYEINAIGHDTTLVLTSQSGESGEIKALIDLIDPQQKLIGITNDPNSTLGKRANILLEMHVEPELAVSTRTYLASLILSDMLCSALLHEDLALTEWSHAIDALAAFLQNAAENTNALIKLFQYPPYVCLMGRGYSRSSVECGALFIKETAKYPSIGLDSGEFWHGPFEMVDANFHSIIFAPIGKCYETQLSLAKRVASLGGKAILVTNGEPAINDDNIFIMRYEPMDERYSPLVDIVAAQLFANYMALHRGFAPGVFRQSSKVTKPQ